MSKIAFIGGGNMAASIIGGLVTNHFSANDIILSDRNAHKCDALQNRYGIDIANSNEDAVAQADYVVMAVKPQVMQEILTSLKTHFERSQCVVISVAAGILCDSITQWLGAAFPVIRVMPNTPSLVGLGASGLYANEHCQSIHKQTAQKIMQAVGITLWVEDEKQIDTITGISGSGPAYFYQLMAFMQKTAEKHGLKTEDARNLVVQTALGAATLAGQSEESLEQLKLNVCSPGGTTEAAILSMQEANIEKITCDGLDAAIARAGELALDLAQS